MFTSKQRRCGKKFYEYKIAEILLEEIKKIESKLQK